MSAKAIYEHFGKELLYQNLKLAQVVRSEPVFITSTQSFDELTSKHQWISQAKKIVIKPDQLIKRRGKLGLVKIGTPSEVKQWFDNTKDSVVKVGKTSGHLRSFIIEPFVHIDASNEKYIAIYSERDRDVILFHHEGGVDIGDVDAKASRLFVAVSSEEKGMTPSEADITKALLANCNKKEQPLLAQFIADLYNVYKELYFTYLEINPFVLKDNQLYILDLAAKLDETAMFICADKWKSRSGEKVDFPPPFGRDLTPSEQYISDLDAKTGASLKLTILNPKGRIWTMVAGGGASVIFTDTVCDLGGATELANYGEYSGDPSETQTYEYAKTIIKLMTEGDPHPQGKVLIIGGSIANFTNVAKTFKGIVRALEEFKMQLQAHNVVIYVRRGGPNYQEGLRTMKETGQTINLPIHVYGPETHMTAVVSAALNKSALPVTPGKQEITTQFLLPTADYSKASWSELPLYQRMSSEPPTKKVKLNDEGASKSPQPVRKDPTAVTPTPSRNVSTVNAPNIVNGHVNTGALFDPNTKAIIWGQQLKAIQGMLDFDYVCSRKSPSVVASTYPLAGDHKQKYYFGHKEILVPAYKKMEDVMRKHPDASVFVSFASMRSVYETTVEALSYPQIRVIAIIAEGVPENQTRKLIKLAHEKGVAFIGPATVGGIKPGCFKIGNTGGMMDNILASKLYRPGSVAYVSRSGGMSNELNNIINRNADGVYEGVAIGGDRYPGSVYVEHLLRYEADPKVKMMVLLGEVGGRLEYDVVDAIKSKKITKPLVAWCIGTCADHITSEVQFGHAGASAHAEQETASSKNNALRAAGAIVPESFDDLGVAVKKLFDDLKSNGVIEPLEDKPPPPVPMDFAWARELGLIRKPASFMTSIVDERGEELLYAGTPISKVLETGMGVGGVISLLWFQRQLPRYAQQFVEMCLILTADHGPAVSGAHNTIVCARAGKDLVSSLVSGLLTIGDRFGGALDGAANMFSEAFDSGLSPMQFVNKCRKEGKLIMGIGHRVKSLNNPDKRVEMLKKFALDKEQFIQQTPLLDYALEVEQITTSKKPNLILNVDGAIAVIFVDILRQSGSFTKEEAAEIIEIGALNGMFVLGRSMGFIGHYLDQKRLKQGLYRHPWDDITYVMPEMASGDAL